MRRLFPIVAVFAIISLASASTVMAGKHSHNRTGFFIGLGVGMGNAGAELQGLDPDRENSVTGNFRFGWALSPNVTLGLENASWTKKYNFDSTADLQLTGSVTAFAVTVFPQNRGFYFRGGIGVASGRAKIDAGAVTFEDTETGFGFLTAMGYEWRLTRKFALGPQLEYAYLNIDGDGTESVNFTSLTAQATWYW